MIKKLLIPALLLPTAMLLALALGEEPVLFEGLFNPGGTDPASLIVWQSRLPRVLLAISGGAALALAGVALQAILMNPLADPFLLGISSAASLGTAIALVLGFSLSTGPWWLVLNALIMALLAAFMVYALAALRRAGPHSIILAGLALNFIFAALLALLQFMAQEGQLRELMSWIMGSLWKADLQAVLYISIVLALGFVLLMSQAWNLNALAAGEEVAHSLGVRTRRVNLFVLLLACLLTAVVVSFMGAVGFIGLLAPHVARSLWGNDHRFLLPAACLCGALLLLLADTCARLLLWPLDLPVGIMTALLGGPFFIFLLLRKKDNWWL